MKTLKRLLLLSLVVVMAASCGGDSDDNEINNNPFSSPFGFGNQTTFTQAQAGQVQQILNSFPCTNGQRLSQVVTYQTQNFQGSNVGTNTINGPFVQGSLPGSVAQLYVGRSNWNDVMIVSKVANGNAVSGFNVSLYMCSLVYQGAPLIHDQRPLSNFRADYGGIVVNDNLNCGFGSVDSAQQTYLLSGQFQQYAPFNVWTTFFKPNCNAGF